MPEGQEKIHIITGASAAAANANPKIEGYKAKGYEVLFYTDTVDEWVAEHYRQFNDKDIVNLSKQNDDLKDDETAEELKAKSEEYKDFLSWGGDKLGDGIKELSYQSLTDSPCVLTDSELGMTGSMADMMRRMGQEVADQPRVLELNPHHPLVQSLHQSWSDEAKRDEADDYMHILHDQAVLAEGGNVKDPSAFAKSIQSLLAKAL